MGKLNRSTKNIFKRWLGIGIESCDVPKWAQSKCKLAEVVVGATAIVATTAYYFDEMEHALAQLASVVSSIAAIGSAVRGINFRRAYVRAMEVVQ